MERDQLLDQPEDQMFPAGGAGMALRFIHLEDDPRDAELIAEMIQAEWPDCAIRWAVDRKGFEQALRDTDPDLILSDYNVPAFDGLQALALAHQRRPSAPFIFVSGHMGEDVAVESLKAGATDYVLKSSPNRLLASVRRALQEVQERNGRKRMEQELRARARFFNHVMESVEDSIVVVDLMGRPVYMSPSFRALQRECGLAGHEDELFAEVHPEDRAAIQAGLAEVVKSGTGRRREYRVMLKDGSTRHMEGHGGAMRNESGEVKWVLVVARDITEQKKAGEQIREQAALLDKAQDAIYTRDLDQRVTYWNMGAKRMYGWTAEEVLGRSAADLLYRSPSPEVGEVRKIVLEKGEWSGELRHVTKSGKEIVVVARLTLLRDQSGRPTAILNINTDVTEQKKIEAQFLRTQRLESIGTLAGGIAHDLNNILAPILMGVQVMRLKEDLTLEEEGILRTMETSAQRGAGMVQQVLSFARGSEGARTVVRIRHLLSEQEKIIRETFPKQISLQTSYARDIWSVEGDLTQLYQVLMNLCVNARDAMPNGGRLALSAENMFLDEAAAARNVEAKPGPYVVIGVADSGVGIAPEILDKIFDPFFTTKPQGQGTGLGLSTVLGIVKSHGGFTQVQSQPGAGARFQIYLPAMVQPAMEPASQPGVELPRGNGELILVIDDERSICEMSELLLGKCGYRVMTARDGIQGLVLFVQHMKEIDLVITDMAMPHLDGVGTIRAVERLKPGVKILVVSGVQENERVSAAATNGEVGFLAKPFSMEGLLTAVTRLVYDGRHDGEGSELPPGS